MNVNKYFCRQVLFHGWFQPNTRWLARALGTQEVRTRFAPSPTGDLHLGSLRSALYNYLMARAHGGTFILRVEDTDQRRTVAGAVDRLQHTLDTIGLSPDEGPAAGGAYGPYTQSERSDLYRQYAHQLLDCGAAYRCFCTRSRLDMTRRQAIRRGEKPRYDNRCRHLAADKRQHLLDRGVTHVVRLKLEDTSEPFQDLVYGPVAFDVAAQEGDPVLLKADGLPTYHLANVVDDHLMRVTHVLRGVEWQVSTPKHIALYRALGWQPPQYAHLPLVTNSDGTKLSKRHLTASVESHQRQGFLPEALLSYVCLAGGGFRQLDQTRLTLLAELTEKFDLTRVHTHSCRLDPERLRQLNLEALRRRFALPQGRADMVTTVRHLVRARLEGQHVSEHVLQRQYVENAVGWALENGRIALLADLVGRDFTYLWAVPDRPSSDGQVNLDDPDGPLHQVADELGSWRDDELTKERLVALFRATSRAERARMPFGRLMKLLRCALSGVEEGPGVAEMMSVLGREETIRRLTNSVGAGRTEKGASS